MSGASWLHSEECYLSYSGEIILADRLLRLYGFSICLAMDVFA